LKKIFYARPLKDVSIFAGFAYRRQAVASRWVSQSAKSSGFCLKKVRILFNRWSQIKKPLQTFSIILPNLIHNSKKRNLKWFFIWLRWLDAVRTCLMKTV